MSDVDAIATVIVDTVKRSIAPMLARLDASDARLATIERATQDYVAVRERLTVLETRAPIPGPPGQNGAPGADGLGFDDLSIDFDGDRTLAIKFARGDVVKTFPIALPYLKYQGTFQDGYPYVIGDVVTSGGGAWHCQKPTTLRPGDSVSAWRLMVRKGRDGRDGNGAH